MNLVEAGTKIPKECPNTMHDSDKSGAASRLFSVGFQDFKNNKATVGEAGEHPPRFDRCLAAMP